MNIVFLLKVLSGPTKFAKPDKTRLLRQSSSYQFYKTLGLSFAVRISPFVLNGYMLYDPVCCLLKTVRFVHKSNSFIKKLLTSSEKIVDGQNPVIDRNCFFNVSPYLINPLMDLSKKYPPVQPVYQILFPILVAPQEPKAQQEFQQLFAQQVR